MVEADSLRRERHLADLEQCLRERDPAIDCQRRLKKPTLLTVQSPVRMPPPACIR
ncbi:Transposase (plasmid) [Mycetohabitans rhizoxinica HKI 454]|uniref:Transposase n=1 Tax=Mycetohabitans rhizoxinica (strain DSM 19002 / CIP 109453 / HKI 454) TaxID=882378 RepID=E5ATR8_MYCRK|nr:Transposase [Mycetohabitans rhizoxinica HKI 454]